MNENNFLDNTTWSQVYDEHNMYIHEWKDNELLVWNYKSNSNGKVSSKYV